MAKRTVRHKHDLTMVLDVDLTPLRNLIDALDEFADRDAGRVAMQRVAVTGLQHALRLLDLLIYDTPERGYTRTRRLRRSMRTFIREENGGPVLYLINDARSKQGAPYPVYNELGTRKLARSPADILNAARKQVPTDLVLIEFGRGKGGLEPRPFFFPTLAVIEHALPIEMERALLERLRRAGIP